MPNDAELAEYRLFVGIILGLLSTDGTFNALLDMDTPHSDGLTNDFRIELRTRCGRNFQPTHLSGGINAEDFTCWQCVVRLFCSCE